MYVVQVEKLLERMRKQNSGRLPLYLSQWEEYQIFAGESGIALPETYPAAKAVFAGNESYPTLGWLEKEYTKLLQNISDVAPEKLKDEPPRVIVRSTLDGSDIPIPAPTPAPETLKEVVEGSVSNVDPKEGDERCLAQSPAILSLSSTLEGSPNTLSMGVKLLPPIPQHLTLTPAPLE